jgi:hypothetical protein
LGGGAASGKADIYTGQHKHRIKRNIHVSSGIRTHDPSDCAGGDSECFIQRVHCDWKVLLTILVINFA